MSSDRPQAIGLGTINLGEVGLEKIDHIMMIDLGKISLEDYSMV